MSFNHKALAAAGLGLYCAAAAPALAQSTEQSLTELRARIDALEAQQAAAPAATTGTMSVSPGIRLSFYGMVKVDALLDSDYDLGTNTVGMAKVGPLSEEGSAQRVHAFQSRFGIRGEHDTDMGLLKFNIEGDFFGGGGGTLRLRHAYAQLGGWTAGQTWSTFSALTETPDVADFNGTAGPANFRVPMVRYTHTFAETTKAEIAIEQDYVSWGSNPSVVAALRHTYGQGDVRLAYIHRELNTVDGDDASGWGANLAGSFKYSPQGTITASFTTGEGISSIMGFSSAAGQSTLARTDQTFFDLDANGEAISMQGFHMGVTHNWTEKFRTILAVGQQSYDDYAGAIGTDTDALQSVHLQARYSLSERALVGAELIHVRRETFDDETFKNNRLQLFAQLNF